jgi:hypothetical protein
MRSYFLKALCFSNTPSIAMPPNEIRLLYEPVAVPSSRPSRRKDSETGSSSTP